MIWCITAALAAEGWSGAWEGELAAGAAKLRVGFTIADTGSGWTATMQSPDQGAMAIPVSSVAVDGERLTVEVAAVHGRYVGKRHGDTIEGTWTQGQGFPLALHRVDAVRENVRPQDPNPPFPYREVAVTFPSETADVTLAGTLTLPAGDGPFPAVALVSGSGPQDRDEALFGHRPFAVLADHLTRAGIAVLRYDDRGVGGSKGTFAGTTTEGFASDATGALRWLDARDDIGHVGLIGHSEGGLVGPMVARDHPELVHHLVLLAGPAVTGAELLAVQGRRIEEAMGVTGAELDRLDKERRRRIAARDGELGAPWMAWFLGYDPVPALKAVRCPVLAVQGALDLQVVAEQNVEPMKQALAGNADATVTVLPGLNHLLQPAITGNVDEYARIETTMDPVALDAVTSWLLAHR
ncbi:MAG: alpha/beta fold hydrolase [Myxococcales bacterium]|nr:alpha/beta fold hydrolase [Myxococcales bacterium]